MKILLIEPNLKQYALMPTISLTSLKSFVNENTCHDAKIIDLAFHKKDWKKFLIKKITEEKPDIIGLSVLSFNYPEALQIARFIKKNFDIKIVFGGVHVILSPGKVIQQKEVDIICIGEGEEVLKDLLDNNLNCKDIKGIWYKKDKKIIKNRKRKLIENLDKLAFPDFEDFDLKKYFIINHHHLPIMASRGCPYSCSYCSNHALKKTLEGKYVRFRSVDNVMEEIESRIKQYSKIGFKYLYFFDDTFILDKDFVYEFCKKFKKKGFHNFLKWTVNVRANLATNKIIKTMKDAGCYQVRMGVESGNQYIRNKVYNRNMTDEQILNSFKTIKKNGLQLRLYFIIGAPEETVEMMEESLELAKKSKADDAFFSLLYPLPGTEIKEVCKKEQVTEQDTGLNGEVIHPITHTNFTSEMQMQHFLRKIRRWQIKKYFHEGLKLRGLLFLCDSLLFLFYYKWKYDLDLNQMYLWNIQKYKLENMR